MVSAFYIQLLPQADHDACILVSDFYFPWFLHFLIFHFLVVSLFCCCLAALGSTLVLLMMASLMVGDHTLVWLELGSVPEEDYQRTFLSLFSCIVPLVLYNITLSFIRKVCYG